jgi:hypothetical protein
MNVTPSPESENFADSREQHDEADTGNRPQSALQFLADAIARQEMGFEGLNAARPPLLRLFGEIQRIHYQISRAFGNQLFNLDLSPTCPANQRRFKAYMECRNEEARLLGRLIELWALTCGFQTIRNPSCGKRRRRRR